MAEELSVKRETVRLILTSDLNVKKVCARMVLQIFRGSKERRKESFSDFSVRFLEETDLLEKVMTDNDPETIHLPT